MVKGDRITRRPPEELTLHLTAVMQELKSYCLYFHLPVDIHNWP